METLNYTQLIPGKTYSVVFPNSETFDRSNLEFVKTETENDVVLIFFIDACGKELWYDADFLIADDTENILEGSYKIVRYYDTHRSITSMYRDKETALKYWNDNKNFVYNHLMKQLAEAHPDLDEDELVESIESYFGSATAKKVKMETSPVSTAKFYKNESIKAAMERNDCVVRAIASAFEIPYDEAHDFVAEIFNRKNKKGTPGTVMKMRNLQEAFGKKVVELGEIIPELDSTQKLLRRWYNKRGKMSWGCYTTERFIEKFPKGTYMVFISKHAFTIKDGIIYGNADDAKKLRARILQAFKVG